VARSLSNAGPLLAADLSRRHRLAPASRQRRRTKRRRDRSSCCDTFASSAFRCYAAAGFRAGLPPFVPFARAAAAFVGEATLPARRAAARAVVIPRYSGSISATEKSMSRLGQTIEAPRSSTLTSKTDSADRERAAVIPLTRDTGKATLVPPTRRTVRTSVFPLRDTAALLARKPFIRDTFSKVATALRGVRRRYVVPGGYPRQTCDPRTFRTVDDRVAKLESPLQRAKCERVQVSRGNALDGRAPDPRIL
jgi:hypothetical protein